MNLVLEIESWNSSTKSRGFSPFLLVEGLKEKRASDEPILALKSPAMVTKLCAGMFSTTDLSPV